jgi:hypothetical protein
MYCPTPLVETFEYENKYTLYIKIQFVCFKWEKKVLLFHKETIPL